MYCALPRKWEICQVINHVKNYSEIVTDVALIIMKEFPYIKALPEDDIGRRTRIKFKTIN